MSSQNQQKRYGKCCSAQGFLYYRADGLPPDDPSPKAPPVGLKALSVRFPRIRIGKAFVEDALARLDAFLAFGVLLVRMDAFDRIERDAGEQYATELLTDTARAVAATCEARSGMWGLIERDLFGCFLPDSGAGACHEAADDIRRTLATSGKETLSVGIAVYPLSQFNRPQTLENCRMALDQAILSGPEGTALFSARSLNVSGDRLYRDGDAAGAAEAFKKALMLDPSDVNVRNSLGVCYGGMGALTSALAEFETTAQTGPENPMPVYNAGLVRLMMKKPDAALDDFNRANDMNTGVFEVAFQTGRLYYEMGEYEQAIVFFENAAKISPGSGPAFRYLGECYLTAGKTAAAFTAYRQAVRLAPDDAVALSVLGYLFGALKDEIEIAFLLCRHSVKIAPENGLCHQWLGRLYMDRGQADEAAAAFESAGTLGCDSRQYLREIREQKTQGILNHEKNCV
ncbi:hypothetical protein DENIS_4102 [Desulfonema ishimotonii]|uniref:GGDEF domain-containing protein n=1 Tax=Desulfonema ishimotonii TaxID=45657 RepID=A0A401G1P6_9BACT|nr:tetratricopeptide repeat protein [Desulfonema ishimotonii]GBC63113.1 hypothetical protein DENIS_4102 [Desulfonema ishimotonii]